MFQGHGERGGFGNTCAKRTLITLSLRSLLSRVRKASEERCIFLIAAARAAAAVPLRPQRMRESLLILDFDDSNAEMRETAPKSPKSHSSRKMRVMYLVVGGSSHPSRCIGPFCLTSKISHLCYSGNVCYAPGIRNINQKMTRHGRDTMAEQPYWKGRKRREGGKDRGEEPSQLSQK